MEGGFQLSGAPTSVTPGRQVSDGNFSLLTEGQTDAFEIQLNGDDPRSDSQRITELRTQVHAMQADVMRPGDTMLAVDEERTSRVGRLSTTVITPPPEVLVVDLRAFGERLCAPPHAESRAERRPTPRGRHGRTLRARARRGRWGALGTAWCLARAA
eukprot:6731982-Prymnesium_polylepis.1